MLFQAIAWESCDVSVTRAQFLRGLHTFPRNDLVIDTLYCPPFLQSVPTGIAAQSKMGAFAVRVAGRAPDGTSVQINAITGFRPYFYLHVENLSTTEYRDLVRSLAGGTEFNPRTRQNDTIRPESCFRDCEVSLVRKIPFVGYHANPERFVRIDCPSAASFRGAKRFLKESFANVTLYESMCDPLVQFWIALRVHPMCWLDAESTDLCTIADVRWLPDHQDVAPFRVVHYDLECYSSVAHECGKNQMPNPEIAADVIIGIGAVVTSSNESLPYDHHYFGIGIAADDPQFRAGTDRVHTYPDERAMLVGFCAWLEELNPDIWNAFNNFGFDDFYLWKRLELHGLTGRMPSRDPSAAAALKAKNFMSSAFQFEAKYLHHPLRMYTDLLLFARREWRSQMGKFSLENVAQVLLGKGKHDVSPREIFEAWASRDPTALGRVGAYCIQDCALVAEIMDVRKVYSSILSRAELFLCDPRDLMLKGQQQIVFNLIFKQVRTETNFCIPDSSELAPPVMQHRRSTDMLAGLVETEELNSGSDDSDDDDDDGATGTGAGAGAGAGTKRTRAGTSAAPRKQKFKGATVLEPKKGAYMCPVSGLDFASLYPSIMVAYNLCHSTKVMTPEPPADVAPEHLYTTELTGNRRTVFVQKDHRRGVLPQILLNLWAMRKLLKKLMAKADDDGNEMLEAVYNAKQLAVKVAMNSIYGFCGADNGKLPMKDIAETVTSNGRILIERSKNYAESWYPCEVVYGDTDSIYVRFFLDELPEYLRDPQTEEHRTELLRWAFARSQECADRISEQYISPITLEFEKVFLPLLLFRKKRYCGTIFEKPDRIKKHDMKGLSVTRRDFSPFVKRVYGTVLKTILSKRDVDGAFRYAEEEMCKLVRGEYPVEDLVVSRSVSKKPEEYANQSAPHLVVGRKNAERTGVPLRVGDRVEFVFRKGTGREKQFELADDPSQVRPEDIDGVYYYEHQILSSLAEVFGLLDPTRWAEFVRRMERVIKPLQRANRNAAAGQREITSFFAPKK